MDLNPPLQGLSSPSILADFLNSVRFDADFIVTCHLVLFSFSVRTITRKRKDHLYRFPHLDSSSDLITTSREEKISEKGGWQRSYSNHRQWGRGDFEVEAEPRFCPTTALSPMFILAR